MQQRITKRSVDALQASDRPVFLWDTDLAGFGCKATPAGRKVYVLQYRLRGRGRATPPKRLTLGKHGELTPDEARKLAAGFLLQVRAGDDPAAAWRRSESPTVADLGQHFLTEYLPGKKRPPRASTIAHYELLFRCHILPALGTKRVEDVSGADIERLHAAMRSTPYVANRTLSLLQQALDQAERLGWRPLHSNPAVHIDRYPEERRGARKEVMLSAKQMRRLLAAIDEEEASGGDPYACAAIRVVFWTGWRIGEVLRLEWAKMDLERGVAKLVRTKTAEEEFRQIPAEAVSVIDSVPKLSGCLFVFPGRARGGTSRKSIGHLTTVKKTWNRIRKRASLDNLPGLGPLRVHDLRHNVVSWDVSRGVPLEIAGRNVGHRSRRATEVYAHFAPDALKRAADERAKAMRAAVEGKERRPR